MRELGRICSAKHVLPKSCTLSDPLDIGPPSASGRIYAGTLGGSRVHIKRVSVNTEGDPKVKEVRS